jgi:hypothetical protein
VAERSCAPLELKVNGDIRMKSGFNSSTFRLENVVITGKFDSVGDTDAKCPVKPEPIAPVLVSEPTPTRKSRFEAQFVSLLGYSGGSYKLEQIAHGSSTPNIQIDKSENSGLSVLARYIPDSFGVEVGFTRLMISPIDTIAAQTDFAFGEVPTVVVYRFDGMDRVRPGIRAGVSVANPSFFKLPRENQPARQSTVVALPTIGLESDFKLGNSGYGRAWIDTRFQNTQYAELSGGLEASYSFADAFFLNTAIQARTRVLQFSDDKGLDASVYEQLVQYRFEVGYFY